VSEPTITCPNCHTEIRLTESLAAPLIEATRQRFAAQLAAKDQEVEQRLATERAKIAEAEQKKARLLVQSDLEQATGQLKDLREVLAERDKKLAEAQKAQAELLRKSLELENAKREMDLNIQKQVQAGLAAAREQAKKEASDELGLRVAEKEQTITAMQKQIEELKRKAEQGSQQLQGEVQELELEELLRAKFPFDEITPVPKGEHGGDVIHTVRNVTGALCGKILWESKRTKNWSDGWLVKLRDDQRAAKAEVAVIVSRALPEGVQGFDLIDHVWVAHPSVATALATALRQAVIDIATARAASEGQHGKMELMYQYLTGPRFKQRVQAIVEAFSTMRRDLDNERKAIIKQWAKRDAEIERVMQATIGMYGDLQGIAGQSLQHIEGLELKALTDESGDESR
jgi:hypothetical protein